MFKNLLKNKKILISIIIGIVVLFVVGIVLFLIINSKRITKLEKIKITEHSNEIINYLDEIVEHPSDEGKYVNFAIEYLYGKEDKTEYSIEEILEVINSNFDLSFDEEKLGELGISDLMSGKGITFNLDNNKYKYVNSNTIGDIADISIVTYEVKNIEKVNKNTFKATYDRLVVEKPYEILNYYNDYNISKNQINEMVEDNVESIDTKDIVDYLKGEGKQSNVKKYIKRENIDKYGKIDGSITITYIIKNDKLLIKDIK